MAKVITETKMKFDVSVGTEDRFSVRRWFGKLVELLNSGEVVDQKKFLSATLAVEGFAAHPFKRKQFIEFLHEQQNRQWVARYPEIKVSVKGGSFILTGTFESFIGGILASEGNVELKVIKSDGAFLLESQIFYPRFLVHL